MNDVILLKVTLDVTWTQPIYIYIYIYRKRERERETRWVVMSYTDVRNRRVMSYKWWSH